jgi:chitinase
MGVCVRSKFLLFELSPQTASASSNPGSNAPLDDACHNSTQPAANAAAAINSWTAAGFPSRQLALGVPSYGYISRSRETRLHQRDQNASSPYVQAVTEEGRDNGPVQFRGLVDQGVLCRDPFWPGGYLGCGGFTREWDSCSSTPFLRSDYVDQVISYDDAQSLGLKSALVKEQKLIGVNMFDIHGDTDQWDLVDSVRRSLGL